MALVRAGAVLCLATSNPGAFRNAWNEFMRETFLPAEIPPLSRVRWQDLRWQARLPHERESWLHYTTRVASLPPLWG